MARKCLHEVTARAAEAVELGLRFHPRAAPLTLEGKHQDGSGLRSPDWEAIVQGPRALFRRKVTFRDV